MSDRELAGPPTEPVEVPAAVRAAAAGHPARAVWVNQLGGITFEVIDPEHPRFVKWSPPGAGDLSDEAARIRWASSYIAVPAVISTGTDARGQWLVTAAIRGENAVSDAWRARPIDAARAIGAGLRHLHDSLPVRECRFPHWSAPKQLESLGLPPRPRADKLVVCHGDPCAPNTLIDEDGRPAGHVDLGALGVADRWTDLAVATWSLDWNYGPGYERQLLDAYEIEPDAVRTAYYRMLWDLSS